MAFIHIAPYLRTGFDQDAGLREAAMNMANGYEVLAGGIDAKTRLGVCLALCTVWIIDKTSTSSFRVKGSAGRMKSWSDSMSAGRAIEQQRRMDTAWSQDQDVAKVLEVTDVPEPIVTVTPAGALFQDKTVLVKTLQMHVCYILVYRWSNGEGHAVICYRTSNRTFLVDPNCGELACAHENIDALWAAYWLDIVDTFGALPITYGLFSVG